MEDFSQMGASSGVKIGDYQRHLNNILRNIPFKRNIFHFYLK